MRKNHIKQDSNNSEAVNVKISVDYPQTSPETKTIIEQNPTGGLRVSWDANEEISLLSFDSDNRLIAVDNLTSTGEKGRRSATFTGSYSKPIGAEKWIILYPALTKDKDGKYYIGDKIGYGRDIWRTEFKINSKYVETSDANVYQTANNDMSHLYQWDVMSARIEDPTVKNVVRNMQKHCAILHFNLSIDPSHAGKKINYVLFSSSCYFGGNSGWGYSTLGWHKGIGNLSVVTNVGSMSWFLYLGKKDKNWLNIP